MFEKTIATHFSMPGIGLHSGQSVHMEIFPRDKGGIVFRRSDLNFAPEIPAKYTHVIDTTMSTRIGTSQENQVSTIEHLMAAFYLAGIDHALVELNAIEMPLADGSAIEFLNKIKEVGVMDLPTKQKFLKIKKEVQFEDEKAKVSIKPAESFIIDQMIDFDDKMIGKQRARFDIYTPTIEEEIGPARTFGHMKDHEKLMSMGLAKGATLENLMVYDDEKILSPGGLRFENEWIRHKILDSVGDLYTGGYRILGEYLSEKGGHYHNNMLLRAIFEDPESYEIIDG